VNQQQKTEAHISILSGVSNKRESIYWLYFNKFMNNRLALAGAIFLITIIITAIFVPFLTSHDPAKMQLGSRLKAPSLEYWLGTDRFGRDLLTRILYGARVSLIVGFVSVFGAITIGTVVGSIAGYFRGWVDAVLMRFVDLMLSIPSFFLIITIVTIFSPGLDKLIMIFAITGWMGTARLVRGEFLSLRTREYVLAAKTIGVSNFRIIFSHILPNAIGPIIVAATLSIGGVILSEAALSYLGLGIQPPTPSWGNMLQDAQNYSIMLNAWWYPTFPGLMILITVLCFNFIGDGLRDAFDPKHMK
jgi:peptide/nickel transport system permease protein